MRNNKQLKNHSACAFLNNFFDISTDYILKLNPSDNLFPSKSH